MPKSSVFHILCKSEAAAEYFKKTLHELRHQHDWINEIEIDFIEPEEEWKARTEGEVLC